ncbi:lysozyme inhibitor LprI family protein [Paracoccus sp. JM45]|uniref:lysozyme inhibitor LprI family protein n=1 Tax=Paracoccus sp. JM45 TaxID=2283626 RepID=UPI000E6D1415|nr:lysozyme inhibitor LprI family protein [Paracoccus sp. JM45]RJE79759.1 DUF1311 domain-containing protein [Paracoccus sp. JM45]
MRAGLAVVIALSGPAMAQDGMPQFQDDLLATCLTEQGDTPEACINKAADLCMNAEGGYSTVGMSYCLSQELAQWDRLLNTAYADVMAQSETADARMDDLGSVAPKQAPLLQQMQRNWIAFRDAACSYEGSRWGGGTGAGPAGTQCLLTQTARQYLWLNAYLSGEQ